MGEGWTAIRKGRCWAEVSLWKAWRKGSLWSQVTNESPLSGHVTFLFYSIVSVQDQPLVNICSANA